MLGRAIACSFMLLFAGCGDGGGETGETSASTTSETTSDTSSETEGTPLDWAGEPEVVVYPRQPMVVDLVLTFTAPARASAHHLSDPGVRISVAPGGDPQAFASEERLRLRGLRPGQDHQVEISVEGEGGEQLSVRTINFTSEPARPGFLSVFPVNIPEAGIAVDPSYRLFDLVAYIPGPAINGVFVVDHQGSTRWYLDTMGVDPGSLFAGLQLRADGTMQFAVDGEIYIIDELGELVYHATPEQLGQPVIHHDLVELPNGHFVAIGASYREVDYGPDIGKLWVAGDTLVEFVFTGPETTEVVWEWDIFDHLDPLRTRSGFELEVEGPDPSTPARDWTHANGVVYRPDDDSFLLSLRHQDWILSIDHATGELNWKLGPDGDFDLVEGTWFYHQHSPEWQADGSMLLYDNGLSNPDVADSEEISRAAIYTLDTASMTARRVWEDDGAPHMSALAGDADRLPNGHILVLDSVIFSDKDGNPSEPHSRLRELNPGRSPMEVWSIHSPAEKFAYRASAWQRLPGEAASVE